MLLLFALASFTIAVSLGQDAEIYAPKTMTVLGCTCKNSCFTGFLYYCYAAPFCSVDSPECPGGKANWSATAGYYDACVYDSYVPYESLAASAKQELILLRVQQDASPTMWPEKLSILTGIISESVRVSMDALADVFPEQPRTKYVHTVGMVGGIAFVSSGDHPYTGLFRGADHGLIRLSSAGQPSTYFTPSAALKFFRDGQPSANFVTMPSIGGQPCTDSNFFAHPFKNHLNGGDGIALKLAAMKFWQATYCPQMVGLSDMASPADTSSAAVFPFELVLQPQVEAQCPCDAYETSCAANLGELSPGKTLFEVRALKEPGAAAIPIGHIKLTTRLTTSKFGDEQLFFRHQHMEDDFAIMPEWLDRIDRKTQCGMDFSGTTPPTIEQGCSSPFNGISAAAVDGMMRGDDKASVFV